MASKRLLELTALAMIGEGVIGAAYPERHLRLWNVGPRRLRSAVATLASHPRMMRVTFAAEALAGLWLARRELASRDAIPEESGGSRSAGAVGTDRAQPDAERVGHVGVAAVA